VKSATLFLKQVCQTELAFLLFHHFPHESIMVDFGDVFKIYNKKILLVMKPVGNVKLKLLNKRRDDEKNEEKKIFIVFTSI
jgi:hypothetical protein